MKGIITWQKEIKDWPFQLPELEIDPLKTGLLIVDISNHDSVTIKRALPNSIKLQHFFRQNGLPVLYCLVGSLLPDARDQHIKRRLTWLRKSAIDPPTLCPKGTSTYEVHRELGPLPTELIIDKNSQGAFNSSAIDYYLQALDIQNLVITGTATSHCVENTARDANDRGYNVILVEDACGDVEINNHQVTMKTFARAFGTVKSTAEVINDFSRLLTREFTDKKELNE